MIIHFTQRIHADELSDGGVILPGTVVIPIQPVHPVKFLAVVLVHLLALSRALVVRHTVRIIVRGLFDRTCAGRHNAVVALMVPEIEAVGVGIAQGSNVPVPPVVFGELVVVIDKITDIIC